MPKSTRQLGQASFTASVANEDEIDIDLDDEKEDNSPVNTGHGQRATHSQVPENLRTQLPESFAKPSDTSQQSSEIPEGITNKLTRFLALDKCLPRRRFLQLVEVHPCSSGDKDVSEAPYVLSYDPEWLAITKTFSSELTLGDRNAQVPRETDRRAEIISALQWVEENVVQKGLLPIPANFEPTASPYDDALGINTTERPKEYSSPQTMAFCNLIKIDNKFHLSDEERQLRMNQFTEKEETEPRHFLHNSSHRGFGGGGRGGGRGGRGRGRGSGRVFQRRS